MDTRFLFALMYEQATAVINAAAKANDPPYSKKEVSHQNVCETSFCLFSL